MASLIIAIVYIAFISLGLPDSLLGSAWPTMHISIGADVSLVGLVSMVICFCTIISSLCSDKMTVKFGTAVVTAVSTLLTAVAMLLFSLATAYWQLILFAIPYGLGAGAIDSALNNYVAVHLSSKHMSWLHCCWGFGATVSPYIMGFAILSRFGWRGGYVTVSIIQLALTLLLFLSIPLWKKGTSECDGGEEIEARHLTFKEIFGLKGVFFLFFGFFCYCCHEIMPMTWASTYFNLKYGLGADISAFFASLFYMGMMLSRAFCGFISEKVGDRMLIRVGALVVISSAIMIALPFKSYIPAAVFFVILGIGCGPIYPSLIHRVPVLFGKDVSGSIIGVQMAFAYSGFVVSPLIVKWTSAIFGMDVLPFLILIFSLLVFIFTEILNKTHKEV